MCARKTDFIFTDYECDAEYWERFYAKNKMKFIMYGRETCPTTKRPHFQGLMVFENTRTLGQVMKLASPKHVEIMKGTIDQNIRYVSKEGATVSLGHMPRPQQGKRTDLAECYRLLDSGVSIKELSRLYPQQWTMYNRAFDKYIQMHKLEPKRSWQTEVIIHQGKTRTGKSTKAFEDGATNVCLSGDPKNPFCGNYFYDDVVLFDDFDPESVTVEWMLKACDKHPFTVNTKGGNISWVPKKIYVTTNTNATKWWKKTKQHDAWLARITRVENFT